MPSRKAVEDGSASRRHQRFEPRWPVRLRVLDWLAVAMFVAGVLCAASGLLPAQEFSDIVRRVTPLLVFLGAVVVLAELTASAEVFDVLAARMAIIGNGGYPALFLMCVALASASTMFLNLDTTAVLLTPVMLALAARVGVDPMPLAMTTVWLANTASLVLPVSNLTNLLAYTELEVTPLEWAQRMWFPQLVSVLVTMVFLWVFHWQRGTRGPDAYLPPPPHRPRRPALFRVACVACVLFVGGVVANLPLELVAPVCAAVLVVAYAVYDRRRLRIGLIPWRLLLMTPGLFLVVGTVAAHGLDDVMRFLIGDDSGAAGALRAAITGQVMSNLVNNLPTYLAGESAVAGAGTQQLLALLVGVNVGPLITPWASLATLIWFERCHAHGIRIRIRTFVLTGALTSVVALSATTAALIVTTAR